MLCPKHGETESALNANGDSFCKLCTDEALKGYVNEWLYRQNLLDDSSRTIWETVEPTQDKLSVGVPLVERDGIRDVFQGWASRMQDVLRALQRLEVGSYRPTDLVAERDRLHHLVEALVAFKPFQQKATEYAIESARLSFPTVVKVER